MHALYAGFVAFGVIACVLIVCAIGMRLLGTLCAWLEKENTTHG